MRAPAPARSAATLAAPAARPFAALLLAGLLAVPAARAQSPADASAVPYRPSVSTPAAQLSSATSPSPLMPSSSTTRLSTAIWNARRTRSSVKGSCVAFMRNTMVLAEVTLSRVRPVAS